MNKIFTILLIIFIFAGIKNSFAQGELNTEKEVFFRNEKSTGFYLNTNGWGMSYRYGKHINAFKKSLYEGDFHIIKHPAEFKITNDYFGGTSRFVYGKTNFCFDLRFGVGMQRELYRKIDKGGVEIRYFYMIGPTLAFLKPIYYEIIKPRDTVSVEKFDIKYNPSEILGRYRFSKGISETTFVPGAFIKLGISFEHGKRDTQLRSLEAGINISGYMKEVRIMENEQNSQLLISLFVSYRFGRVFQGGQYSKLNKPEDAIEE